MKAAFSVNKMRENLSQIHKAVATLTEQDVFIGVPEDKDARKNEGATGISNAYLSYIHNTGVPEKNIPARPSLLPGIEDTKADTVELLKGAAKQALEGNENAVETAFNKIGLLGQNAVRARFSNNEWPPLQEATLDARKKTGESENKKGEKIAQYAKSRRERGAINPLMDTLQLLKAHTYVIRKRGNKQMVIK